jgi:hypothetical protein
MILVHNRICGLIYYIIMTHTTMWSNKMILWTKKTIVFKFVETKSKQK